METLQAHSNNSSTLRDRILWYDGDSSYYSNYIQSHHEIIDNIIYVDEVTPDIEKYNNLVPVDERILKKTTLNNIDICYNIPNEYNNMDVISYIIDKLYYIDGDKSDFDARSIRCAKEIVLFKKHNMIDILKTLIFIINTLESKNIVWGVGRGSSVASYVLYLIGVHDIDSFKYCLDITEFIK